jgi:Flp pilus assembly protein TadD
MTLKGHQQTQREVAQAPKPRPSSRQGRLRRRAVWVGAGTIALAMMAGGVVAWLRPRTDLDAIWKTAEDDLKAGQIDRAEAASARLGRLRNSTPLDWMLRAQVDIARGRTDSALAALDQVPHDHPMAAQARLMAGQIELRRHRARLAEGYFREAVRIDPGLVQAHRELIYIYGYQLRRAELNAEFQALSEITDLTYDNAFHWCLMRNALWEPGTAVDELSLFIQTDPEDRWSRLALAENYRRMSRFDDVEAVLAPLPESDKDAMAIRVLLALDRHQDDRAEVMLRSSPPDDPNLARLRGRLAMARRDMPEAVHCFRTALAGLPEDRDALFGLSNSLILQGDEKSAAPLRETVKKLELLNSLVQRAANPNERGKPELIRELGAACAALGRDSEARAWYKLAIASDPLDTIAQQSLFQLNARAKPITEPARTPQG